MKKKSAVVFCGTSNHLFAMACVIMDLKRFSPNIADEILILHDGGVQDSDKKLINRIFATRFIEYNFPIQDTSIFDQGTLRYFSEMVYAKFECLKLLNDYKTILFLDYDIVITKDISELMSPCASGIKMLPAGNSVKDQLLEEYRNIKLEGYDLDAEGICGSTFVFQDNLKNYMEMYDFCYEKLRDCAKYLYTAEQAIFDFMIQKFNLQAVFLDPLKYTPHPRDPVKDASILHAYGQPKFWNGIENEQWQKNYAAWVEMGGTKYNTKQTPKRFFKKTARKINNMIDRGRFFVGLIKNFKKTRKNALIYNYFSSQQFKSNPWTFDQCKNYGKDFEKTFYDKNFAEKFGQLLSGLDDDSQKELKFIFLRMLWLAAFNRDSLYTENEIAAFTQTSEKKARKEKGYFLFEGFKFKNQNMTGHNFYNDMGLGLLSNTVLAGLKDKDVLDIGAYVGDSALMLSRYPVAHIYAFEPFDDAFDELTYNIKLNEVTNIHPVKLGASDFVGTKKLFFGGGLSISTNNPDNSLSKGSCTNVVQIPTTTIDAFVLEKKATIGVIKIDAEGAEQEVLRGAVNTIKKDKPILLISLYHNIDDFMNIKPWVDELNLGYKYKINKPEPTTFVEETLLVCY